MSADALVMSAAGPLVSVRIGSVGSRERAKWAEGLRVQWPASLLDRIGWRRAIRADGWLDVPPDPAPISNADLVALRERCAFTEQPPPAARLPFGYTMVPAPARSLIATAIGRRNRRRVDRWAAFPAWPIDLSVDALDDLRDLRPSRSAAPSPVILTHDIDSPEGLRNLVDRFLPLEEEFGARSTNYIVPCGWPVDDGLMREVIARGHDAGVHGYDHNNRTPFVDDAERNRRLDAGQALANRYTASGYRAPSLLRTRTLLRAVGRRYRYDSSIPTSGGLFPVPNNGCATARPFLIEGCAELPITLPRDGSLRFLGYSPDEIVTLWRNCADLIAQSGGIVVLLTHCEQRFTGSQAMFDAYRGFLEHVTQQPSQFDFSRPGAILV